jgi:hypothetical protein
LIFQNSPLGLSHSSSTSYKPLLKNPGPPLSSEATNFILKNLMVRVGGGRVRRNKPPPPPPINPCIVAKYGPLNIPPNTHDLPENYIKFLLKYDEEKDIIVQEHMVVFQDFIYNLFVGHDVVFMRLFVQTFEGYVNKWFIDYPLPLLTPCNFLNLYL